MYTSNNKKIIVRKSSDSDNYIAYGYIKIETARWNVYREHMIWFSGKSYMEALTAAMEY